MGSTSVNSGGEQGSSGQSQLHQFGNMTFQLPQLGQIPPFAYMPFQVAGANFPSGERLGNNSITPESQVEAEKKFLENQIQVPDTALLCFLHFPV